MNAQELKNRTKAFALRIAKLAGSFPRTRAGNVVGHQSMKAGTAVAADYRAACRGRSRAEFLAKLGLVEEEADESLFWIAYAVDLKLVRPDLIRELLSEGEETLSIVVKSRKTTRASSARRGEMCSGSSNRQSSIDNRQ